MAFPFASNTDYEDGTLGSFDSEVDTNSKLDFPHYSALARIPGIAMPYQGAYCMRVDLAGGTADAYVQEDTSWDLALDATLYFRFMLWVSPTLTMADTNEFIIWQLQSTGPVTEAVCAINFTTANGLRIGIGETAATSFLSLTTNRWHSVEIFVNLDAGGGNDGTLDLWLDGAAATQVTGLDQAAIVQGRLGTMGIDAGTTAGVLLFDQVIADDARIFPPEARFRQSKVITKSGHAFVGPGTITNLSLLAGTAGDNLVQIYDTDVANTSDYQNRVAEIRATLTSASVSVQNEIVESVALPKRVERGAYLLFSGTNTRAIIDFEDVIAWGSDGAIRGYGLRRRPPHVLA